MPVTFWFLATFSQEMNGTDLLAEYRNSRSDRAFAGLVERYTNLVYSAARRRLGTDTAAQEATQAVFIRLATAAPDLRDEPALVSWLHRTAVHLSIDIWRAESRRRVREEQAAAMQSTPEDNSWNDLAPIVDEALNDLPDSDRKLILLRFFDHQSMRELGAVFGISEDAAKMRVSRALDRLRERLGPRSAAVSSVALGVLLTRHSVEAAPAAVAAALLCMSWPIPTFLGAAPGIAFTTTVTALARSKPALGLAGAVLLGGLALFLKQSPNPSQVRTTTLESNSIEGSPAVPNKARALVADQGADVLAKREPDARELLEGVARARESVRSGTMELACTVFQHFRGETNEERMILTFDMPRVRSENFKRQYAYSSVGSDESERKIGELHLNRAQSVEAGLLKGFDAHTVNIYDGTAVLRYSETDGRSSGAVIEASTGSSAEFLINPQALGLNSIMSAESTVRSCMPFAAAQYLQLQGKEDVEGRPAWHVQVVAASGWRIDFWIDVARPTQVVKAAEAETTVLSTYYAGDILPHKVYVKRVRQGQPFIDYLLVRTASEFGAEIPRATWTLAGLNMKPGTSVVDVRSHRAIGSWNGVSLNDPPGVMRSSNSSTETTPPPDREELLTQLAVAPASPEAFEAARWILSNTPDGPDVQKAAEVMAREHLRNTNVIALCERLEQVRYRCSTNLLKGFLGQSPSLEVRTRAGFLLALMKKEEAHFGRNAKATAEALEMFDQVLEKCGQRRENFALDLRIKSKRHIDELTRLVVGQPAPQLDGIGFNGEQISLSDYAGRVVVVVFWCCEYTEAREHSAFVKAMEGRPVTLIGVGCDESEKKSREPFAKYDITWPNIWDKRYGPLAERWLINSWPNIWVIDPQGIIRFRDVRGPELIKAVNSVLDEFSKR